MRFPEISPILIQIGPLALRWYGLMYAISFFILVTVMRKEAARGFLPLNEKWVERLFLFLVFFILGWARIFYVVFYGSDILESGDFFELFALWHGGLSFHGGLFGIALSTFLVSRFARVPWTAIVDTLVLVGPIGIFLGRIGNFINGELFGRVTTVPWGMIFPTGGPDPRHPSQLYEALCEGLILALLLWFLKGRVKRYGILTSVFLMGYGIARFSMEFFRQPDAQLGFILGPFTMGQLLTLGILLPGVGMFLWARKHGPEIRNKGFAGNKGFAAGAKRR